MEYILFLTYQCNLSCAYCFAKGLVHNNEKRDNIMTLESVIRVCEYIEKDIKANNWEDNSIVFFGGEPSLVPNVILDIIARTSHIDLNYSIYTNGLVLDSLPDSILEKLQSVFVAIDGDKEVHETYKPLGSYDKVLRNVNTLRNKTKTQFIARITMEESTNIFHSVMNLLDHFDHVHWQIVNKESFRDPTTLIENYSFNVQMLFNEWKKALRLGIVLNIIPFNRIVLSLLKNENLLSFRCGCGSSTQAIDINGNIFTCDEYIGNQKNSIGNIQDNNYNLICYISHQELFDDCVKCDVSSICLGRCRKLLETQSAEHIRIYCALTKALLNTIMLSLDEIKQIIKEQKIDLYRLNTDTTDTEIIP